MKVVTVTEQQSCHGSLVFFQFFFSSSSSFSPDQEICSSATAIILSLQLHYKSTVHAMTLHLSPKCIAQLSRHFHTLHFLKNFLKLFPPKFFVNTKIAIQHRQTVFHIQSSQSFGKKHQLSGVLIGIKVKLGSEIGTLSNHFVSPFF